MPVLGRRFDHARSVTPVWKTRSMGKLFGRSRSINEISTYTTLWRAEIIIPEWKIGLFTTNLKTKITATVLFCMMYVIYIVTYNLRERECHAGCIIPSITRPVRTDKMQSMERAITAVCFWFYIRHWLMVRWSALAITKHTRILIYLNETRQRLIGNFGMTDHLNSALFLYLHRHPYSQALNHTPLLVD